MKWTLIFVVAILESQLASPSGEHGLSPLTYWFCCTNFSFDFHWINNLNLVHVTSIIWRCTRHRFCPDLNTLGAFENDINCIMSFMTIVIENTRWVSFDIKFTGQGFESACWHREACRAIQHVFSMPSLVNLISKYANLVFYLSVYPLLKILKTSDYDVIFGINTDSASLATSFKKCNVIMTW